MTATLLSTPDIAEDIFVTEEASGVLFYKLPSPLTVQVLGPDPFGFGLTVPYDAETEFEHVYIVTAEANDTYPNDCTFVVAADDEGYLVSEAPLVGSSDSSIRRDTEVIADLLALAPGADATSSEENSK